MIHSLMIVFAACLALVPAFAKPKAKAAGVSTTAQASAGAQAKSKRPGAAEVLKQMLGAQKRLAVLSCKVIREESSEGEPDAPPKVVQGQLRLKSGGKGILEVKDPSPQSVISDGKTVWLVLPEAKQVMRQSTESLKTSGQFFMDLGESIRYYSKNSHFRLVPPGKGFDASQVSALELIPFDPNKSGFDKVVLWISHQDWMIQQVSMDAGGSKVNVRFENVQALDKAAVEKDRSKDLPDSLFDYKIPEGFEVFDSLIP